MKIFHCAKCNKTEADFKISEKELRIRQTWLNLRDGYGGAITHMICPNCGYVLSGFINWHKEVDNDVLDYIKSSIKMYSTREDSILKEGMLDYICNNEINIKQEKYNDTDDEYILNIIKTMTTMPKSEDELELFRLVNKYPSIGSFIHTNSLKEEYVDTIINILSKNKDIYGEYFNKEKIETGIKGYLRYPKSKQGKYFEMICKDCGIEGYLYDLEKTMNKEESFKIKLIPAYVPSKDK